MVCSDGGSRAISEKAGDVDDPAQEQPSGGLFEDISSLALDFRHDFGGTGKRYFPEITGSGVALFDYDNDGDTDLFLVQNASFEQERREFNRGSRLFRNDLTASGEGLQFTDVTEESGIQAMGIGMGAITGDFNNDGWIDLYITNHGPNQLWMNTGDGRFRDITDTSGTADAGFGVSATFVDYDRDGLLDLYVGNYVVFQPNIHLDCMTDSGALDYCGPDAYNPAPDRMFRNLGDGRFRDVTVITGLATQYGPTLGVIAGDWNGDGWQDLYIANDGAENFYWVNQG